jgi:hypothetical protein
VLEIFSADKARIENFQENQISPLDIYYQREQFSPDFGNRFLRIKFGKSPRPL